MNESQQDVDLRQQKIIQEQRYKENTTYEFKDGPRPSLVDKPDIWWLDDKGDAHFLDRIEIPIPPEEPEYY